MISEHAETLRVRHAPDDIFELVSDVERYPEFIPYLTSLRVQDRKREGTEDVFKAEALARYKFAKERFVTEVKADRITQRVRVDLIEGPFNVLKNCWKLSALPDGSTRIDFELAFEFSNMMLGVLMRASKDHAVRILINRFVAEAKRRYTLIGDEELDELRTVNA